MRYSFVEPWFPSSTQSAMPPRYVNYMKNDSRLATFNSPKWLVKEKPNKFLLAEQGFFFTGRDDLVRCYQCGIGLKDWIRSDDVMSEHRKYSPTCSLLLQKTHTPDGNSGNSPVGTGNQTSYKVRSPQYQTMESRIKSFDRFPSNIGIPPQQLAVAGLFFTGDGDLCRCFTCDGGLKDWSSGDDPCKEHATYFPNCSYINQLKGADYVREMQRRRDNNMQSTTHTPDGNSGNSPVGTGNQTSYKVRSPQYQTMESRIKSFDRFPSNIGISPQQLAVAGLFFTGDGDLCCCFTCDGGLKDWSSGDDPCKEHATYFPNCSYINQLKGADYVREMQRRRENNMQSTGPTSGTSTQTSTGRGSTSSPAARFSIIAYMERLNITCNYNSILIDDQLKDMGVSDSLVENARAKLRRRGVSYPSVNALMNAILEEPDIIKVFQETSSSRQDTSNAMRATRNTNDGEEIMSNGVTNPSVEALISIIPDIPDTTNANQKTSNLRQEIPNAMQETSNASQATTNTTSGGESGSKEIQELDEEYERPLKHEQQCMLCMQEESNILFLPCTHHRICHNCSEWISRCPLCNTVIKEKVRTYLA